MLDKGHESNPRCGSRGATECSSHTRRETEPPSAGGGPPTSHQVSMPPNPKNRTAGREADTGGGGCPRADSSKPDLELHDRADPRRGRLRQGLLRPALHSGRLPSAPCQSQAPHTSAGRATTGSSDATSRSGVREPARRQRIEDRAAPEVPTLPPGLNYPWLLQGGLSRPRWPDQPPTAAAARQPHAPRRHPLG